MTTATFHSTLARSLAIAAGALALAFGGAAQAAPGGWHGGGGGWHGGGGYHGGGYYHGGYYHGGGYYRGGWGWDPLWGVGLGLGLGLAATAPYYYDNGPDVVYVNPPAVYPPAPVYVQSPPAQSMAAEPIFYPRNGQNAAQTEADRQDCNRWATTQPKAMADASVFQRATFACMDGRGYTPR